MTADPPGWFEELYARTPDPWGLATSPYEQAKYQATVAALGKPRFAHGFELGCSIGVLTEQLAAHCDALLAVDVAQAALDQARRRCAHLPQVRLQRLHAPAQWPEGAFDLIVLSEVLYFLAAADIQHCARRAMHAAPPGGTVLLVNWLGDNDRPVDGNAAAELFIAGCAGQAELDLHSARPLYRIDRLIKR
jgi:SAM-dependent methyltransferase